MPNRDSAAAYIARGFPCSGCPKPSIAPASQPARCVAHSPKNWCGRPPCRYPGAGCPNRSLRTRDAADGCGTTAMQTHSTPSRFDDARVPFRGNPAAFLPTIRSLSISARAAVQKQPAPRRHAPTYKATRVFAAALCRGTGGCPKIAPDKTAEFPAIAAHLGNGSPATRAPTHNHTRCVATGNTSSQTHSCGTAGCDGRESACSFRHTRGSAAPTHFPAVRARSPKACNRPAAHH